MRKDPRLEEALRLDRKLADRLPDDPYLAPLRDRLPTIIRNAETLGLAEIEMQRLQLMLTQDLNVLADFASNWAVRFNVELSRGSTPYRLSADDELHKKLTGGFSVSF